MQFFYEEQLHRMECMAQEPVLFEDILCQIVDMIGPEVDLPVSFIIIIDWLHFPFLFFMLCLEASQEKMTSNGHGYFP